MPAYSLVDYLTYQVKTTDMPINSSVLCNSVLTLSVDITHFHIVICLLFVIYVRISLVQQRMQFTTILGNHTVKAETHQPSVPAVSVDCGFS